jgi:hypothetical protein
MSRFFAAAILVGALFSAGLKAQDGKDCVAPSFHGLSLGMTVKQVKATVPFLEWSAADKYAIRTAFKYVTNEPVALRRLPRVFSIELWFVKEQLVKFKIKYYGSTTDPALRTFISRVAEAKHLPIGWSLNERTCQCSESRVSIAQENKRSVEVADSDSELILVKAVEESFSDKK